MSPTARKPASEVIIVTADSGDDGGDELDRGLFGPRRSSKSSLSPLTASAASPVTGNGQAADFDDVIVNLYKPEKYKKLHF